MSTTANDGDRRAVLDRTIQRPCRKRRGPDPTGDQFGAYGQAFDFFNQELFGNELPRCILNFSRRARSQGFFAPERWNRGEDHTHEISINPDVLDCPVMESMGILAHEMAHLWQQEFGTPSRRGYHNAEWADKMEAIGLMPSDTLKLGGKRTGQRVGHYVIRDGPFDRAFRTMPPEYQLPWTSGSAKTNKPKRQDKIKYECPGCAAVAWSKAGLNWWCGDCNMKCKSYD
jgi:predicted SprT family Zn-dependent metalloprotease